MTLCVRSMSSWWPACTAGRAELGTRSRSASSSSRTPVPIPSGRRDSLIRSQTASGFMGTTLHCDKNTLILNKCNLHHCFCSFVATTGDPQHKVILSSMRVSGSNTSYACMSAGKYLAFALILTTIQLPLQHPCVWYRRTRMLVAGFQRFQHHHHEAHQLQCMVFSRNRLFTLWRRVVRGRVGDWMQGSCLASTRRRLHLKGWLSEQQWHHQHETHRSAVFTPACVCFYHCTWHIQAFLLALQGCITATASQLCQSYACCLLLTNGFATAGCRSPDCHHLRHLFLACCRY